MFKSTDPAALPEGARTKGAGAPLVPSDAEVAAREATAERRDADGPVLDRALEVVREFIRERGLVLYGGQAVDYALRLREGAGIYPDHQRPDLDFYSPRNVDDAYDLAERLADRGFPNVGVIRAIHVQTMRVRVDFVSVADVSFVPLAVFDRLPSVDFGGSRALHPDFQRLDMHLAFCFPFNGPPREDIFHRFGKDLRRFNRFEAAYPVAGTPLPELAAAAKSSRRSPPVDLARCALHGFAAYAGLLRALGPTLDAAGKLPRGDAAALDALAADFAALPRLEVEVGDDASVRHEVPDWAAAAGCADLVVVTPFPDAAGDGALSRPLMDVRPASRAAEGLVTYDVRRRLLAVSRVALGGPTPALLPTAQYVLLYFLLESHLAADAAARAHFRGFYAATLEVLRIAEAAFGLLARAPRGDVARLLLASPFGLCVDTLGDVNESPAFLIRRAQTLRDRERACGPPAEAEDLPCLEGVPQNYNPPAVAPGDDEAAARRARARPAFDYAAAPGFDLDGGPA